MLCGRKRINHNAIEGHRGIGNPERTAIHGSTIHTHDERHACYWNAELAEPLISGGGQLNFVRALRVRDDIVNGQNRSVLKFEVAEVGFQHLMGGYLLSGEVNREAF